MNYGDIYWGKVEGYGSDKPRPWVVLSDRTGPNLTDVMVIPCTTTPPRIDSNVYVPITINGRKSWAKCSHIYTIKPAMLTSFIFELDKDTKRLIREGVQDAITAQAAKPVTPTPPPSDTVKTVPPVLYTERTPNARPAPPDWAHIKSMNPVTRAETILSLEKQFGREYLEEFWCISKATFAANTRTHAKTPTMPAESTLYTERPLSQHEIIFTLSGSPQTLVHILPSTLKALTQGKKYKIEVTEITE